MLDKLIERCQVRPLVDEEEDPPLLNLKVVALFLPQHAEYIELFLLVAVPDQEGAVPSVSLTQQGESLFSVNVGVVPLGDVFFRMAHRIPLQEG